MHQRSLVLAVAEAAGEDRLHRVRLEGVDAEFEPDVAGARDDEVVHGADARCFLALGDSLHRFLRGGADVVGHAQLVLDQAPIEATHVVPGPVGGDVNVREHLAVAGHRRLGNELGDVPRRPAAPAPAILRPALGVDQALERRRARIERPSRRAEQDVVGDAARLRRLQIGEVAEVVGEEVRAGIVGPGDQLEHVSRLELGEPDHAGAQIVIEPVPGLGEIALPFRLALEHAAVLAVDARALDFHHLPVGRVLHALHPRRIDAARGVCAQDELAGARREPVREHLHHGEVRQHFHVLARKRLQLRQLLRVVQIRRCVLLLGAHRPHQLAQRRVLRPQ